MMKKIKELETIGRTRTSAHWSQALCKTVKAEGWLLMVPLGGQHCETVTCSVHAGGERERKGKRRREREGEREGRRERGGRERGKEGQTDRLNKRGTVW